MLHVEVSGTPTDAPRLVLVHGFTQTGLSWGHFGQRLEPGRQLVRVDLPGHGRSDLERADLPASADLVVEAGLAAGGGGVPAAGPAAGPASSASSGATRFDLLGYSLGARVALHAALRRPDALRRLVLIGVTPGIEDPDVRAARRARDESTAGALEADGDVEAFLRRWLSAPMFAGLRDPGLEERRRNSAPGLASSLRLAGTGTQHPLWDLLPDLEVPTLLVAGADDLRFAVTAVRMARAMPNAVASLVAGAGHAAHLAQPDVTAAIVNRFLDR